MWAEKYSEERIDSVPAGWPEGTGEEDGLLWMLDDFQRESLWPFANTSPPMVKSLLVFGRLRHSVHQSCAAERFVRPEMQSVLDA